MNLTRRLGFLVGRLWSTKYFLQVEFGLGHPSNILYRSNDVSVKIYRNLSSDYSHKSEKKLLSLFEEDEGPSFNDFLLSHTPCGDAYAKVLMEALNCEDSKARKILRENIYWKNFPSFTIVERIKAYKRLGVKETDLVEQPSLLFIDFEHNFELINLLCNNFGCNGHDLFPLLLLPMKTIQRFLAKNSDDSVDLGDYKSRIRYLSTKLEVPPRHIAEIIVNHQFLHAMGLKKLMEVMDILIDGGMSKENILNDVNVFSYNPQRLRCRMSYCHEVGIRNFKPWLLRSSAKKFTFNSKRILLHQGDDRHWTEFVAQSLNICVDEVKAGARFDRRSENISIHKAKINLKYLLAEGFAAEHIVKSPQAFIVSVHKLERKIRFLRKIGIDPVQHWEFLRRSCYSDKDFKSIAQSYLETGGNTSTSVHDES